MKNVLKTAAMVVAIATVTGAYAQKPKKSAPKTMVCPSCHMTMGMKKTAKTPVAVKTKNGVYYCCAACASGKAAMKGTKKK
ncbi:MAG: hypothetical protein P4L46_01260 [Fimbriimonas sp.]|nr:hypothetical protein [Fimbriimonas sp.]